MPSRGKTPARPLSGRGGWGWWSVRVLIRCTCTDPEDEGDLWDHSILLVKARNESEARKRGTRAARLNETEYTGGTGYRVRWRLDRVLECYELLDDLEDGAEVHSRLGRGRRKERPEDPMDGWSASRRLEREVLRDRRRN